MDTLSVRNVNYAYHLGAKLLRQSGILAPSRGGDVVEYPVPVTTMYALPQERVLFEARRDANPFFHLMEALWILAGRKDVAFLATFNKRMALFSDDGVTFHAPYGFRLRQWGSGFDQIKRAIALLKEDSTTRQCVLSIWDPLKDLGSKSKDLPCNDTVKLEARNGKLNMIVFCRSNDMVWGAYGANVVQFSILQEYLAGMTGLPVGYYSQISCNFHAYVDVFKEKGLDKVRLELDEQLLRSWLAERDPYDRGWVTPFPLVSVPETWDQDLAAFMLLADNKISFNPGQFRDPFFTGVACPMLMAHRCYKAGDFPSAFHALDAAEVRVGSVDWLWAARHWLARREEARHVAR